MADDGKDHGEDFEARDAQDEGFDPWADLEADGTADQGEEPSLSFEDVSLDAALDGPEEELPGASGVPDGGLDDALVDAWLEEPAAEPAESASLSVFVPDDPADAVGITEPGAPTEWQDESAAIEIGTGHSGVTSASDLDVLGLLEDPSSTTEPPAGEPVFGVLAEHTEPESVTAETMSFVGEAIDEEPAEADIIDFGTAAAGAATLAAAAAGGDAVAVAAPADEATSAAPRRRGLMGGLLGILLGGLLAIPIVLGILIGLLWMGWQDTAGIRRWVPPQLAFLLPETRGTAMTPSSRGPDLSAAPSLDDPQVDATAVVVADPEVPSSAPAVTEPAATPPALEEPASAAAPPAVVESSVAAVESSPPAVAEPPEAVDDEPVMQDAAQEPVAPESVASKGSAGPRVESPVETPVPDAALTPPVDQLAAIVPPAVMDDPVVPTAEPVIPPAREPEPLDLGSLEAAIADATAALDDVKAVSDAADPDRTVRLVTWYRHLTRVAQELTMLEHQAIESGRPLTATPAPAADLGGRLLATPELAGDLARLARNWLAYSRRDSDGVVLPATLSGARRVGPYWCSRVAIAEAGGTSRDVSVISRVEPAAQPGDAVIVVGLVMDGGVLWAADLRSAGADAPPADGADDLFSQPGL